MICLINSEMRSSLDNSLLTDTSRISTSTLPTAAALCSVVCISKEMRISLDAVVFHDEKPREIPKVVADFFAGKSDAEAERYIALCQSAEKLKNGE